jgi:hypothetical protein
MGAGATRYGTLSADASGVSLGSNAAIPLSFSTNNTTRVTVTSAGNVGIGVTVPTQKLQISDGTLSNFYVAPGYNSGSGTLLAVGGSEYLAFATNGLANERARITSSGQLLVGTSSTSSLARARFEGATSGSGGIIDIARSSTSVSAGSTIGLINFTDNTATPRVGALIIAEGEDTWNSNDYPTRLVFSTTADAASSPTERMRVSSDGSLYIGGIINTLVSNTISSAYLGDTGRWVYNGKSTVSVLDINQTFDDTDARNAVRFYRNETEVGSISVSTTATAYNTSSDYRLKENVVPLIGAADRINQLQVHRFNFIADPGKTVDGFLAHEAQAVVPECVTGEKDAVDADGNPVYQGIDQSKLVPLLTAALQEALQKIEDLEGRLTAAGL